MPQPAPANLSEERRKGPDDRRLCAEDRRNAERIADDFAPRRNPEIPDRRER